MLTSSFHVGQTVKASTTAALVIVATALTVLSLSAEQPASASSNRPGLIAFTRYRLQNSPLWSEIWVARPDGSQPVKVSHSANAVEDDQAHFSPDGRWIVFDRCTQRRPVLGLARPARRHRSGSSRRCRAPSQRATTRTRRSLPTAGTSSIRARMGHRQARDDLRQRPDRALLDRRDEPRRLAPSRPARARQLAGRVRGAATDAERTNAPLPLIHLAPGSHHADALFVAPRTGGPARRITPLKLWASGGEISPDGQHVLFHSTFVSGELTPGNAMYTVVDQRSRPPSVDPAVVHELRPDRVVLTRRPLDRVRDE